MGLYEEVKRYNDIEQNARNVVTAFDLWTGSISDMTALTVAVDDLRADLERED